jgi:hypothetical protein
MDMELWWNDNDSGKPKYLKKNLSHCHSVHHKSHMDWPGIEPSLHSEKAVTNCRNDAAGRRGDEKKQ